MTPFLRAVLGTLVVLAATFVITAPASAAAPSPWWHLTQRLIPSRIEPEGEGTIVVQAINLGDAATSGEYQFADTLPPGLAIQEAHFFARAPEFIGLPESQRPDFGPNGEFNFFGYCQQTSGSVTCTNETNFFEATFCEEEGHPPGCTELQPVVPFDLLEMKLKVKAEPGVEPGLLESNQLNVVGGGASAATLKRPVPIGTAPVPFGLEHFAITPEEEGGQVADRAGSHPFQLTTDTTFNRINSETLTVPALPRDLHFELPPGMLGNATVAPKCSDVDFGRSAEGGNVNLCPSDTAIGAAIVTTSTDPGQEGANTVPVFNLRPAPGEPARFGFEVLRAPVILDTSVRSGKGEDYGVTVSVDNTTQLINLISATTVFWGAPASSTHNASRGWGCLLNGQYSLESGQPCETSSAPSPPAFLTLPINCAAPFNPLFEGISWPTQAAPDGVSAPRLEDPLSDEAGNPLGIVSCNQVGFDPRTEAEPTSNAATSGTGLNFAINFADEGLLNDEGVAQSQLKKAVVTLPQGLTANPSLAEGLKACSETEYDAATVQPGTGCGAESKIGSVEIESPLVEPVIHGSLYVARQGENPNGTSQNPKGNLLTIYLVAQNPEIGVLVRQALRVTPDPVTGQLTTEVDDAPQLPFSHFRLSFRSGQRSPLITPPACGSYAVKSMLYPWSNPASGVERDDSFQLSQGPEGQGCPGGGVPPFHPNLVAGSENPTAGAYSPFYTDITRKDSEQEITRFSIKLPTGMLAKLKGVSECSDAQVAAAKAREKEGGGAEEESSPSCPANSLIGHSDVGAGVGTVLAYAPGKLYLAGPYHGSPISLVSITAAKVGPFDLGTVVVRFALDVDHETAEVSVDGSGSDPIPHIIDGIPVHLRDIQAFVDRPGFTLNPTSCVKKSTAATILGSGLDFASSSDDVPVTVSSPFQVASCASLGFAPKLALSLTGKKTHRGALPAFKAVLTYPKGGAYANIAKAQVTLPPSEFLEQGHLKNVCTRKVFETGANPGENCPKNSIYGKARATTPLLEAPLEGPVYLRTGYGTKLPELAAALNGPQISITLAGKIDSVHVKGTEGSRIRNTFAMVPDAPVEKFTLELKGGKKGLLVNSTDVCKGTHKALAAFTGQNGKLHEIQPALKAQCGNSGGKKSKGKQKPSKSK